MELVKWKQSRTVSMGENLIYTLGGELHLYFLKQFLRGDTKSSAVINYLRCNVYWGGTNRIWTRIGVGGSCDGKGWKYFAYLPYYSFFFCI